ncbi:MAG: ATP-dependent Clp protease proteolytic subunit [Alphaproteobacteria bacterium]
MQSDTSLPGTVYTTFAGPIDQQSLPRIFHNFAAATQRGVKVLHLLFQSTGGLIGDGISLYNYLRTVPLDLHIYNTGSVHSIAVLGYLAGKHRYISATGSFMIHKVYFPTHPAGDASRFKAVADALVADDARIEAILRAHTNIPAEKWALYQNQDVIFDAQQAVQCGIAHSIQEFQVPPGNQLFHI